MQCNVVGAIRSAFAGMIYVERPILAGLIGRQRISPILLRLTITLVCQTAYTNRDQMTSLSITVLVRLALFAAQLGLIKAAKLTYIKGQEYNLDCTDPKKPCCTLAGTYTPQRSYITAISKHKQGGSDVQFDPVKATVQFWYSVHQYEDYFVLQKENVGHYHSRIVFTPEQYKKTQGTLGLCVILSAAQFPAHVLTYIEWPQYI